MSRFRIEWQFANLGLTPFELGLYFGAAERRWRNVVAGWPSGADGQPVLESLKISVDIADLNPGVPPDSDGLFTVARVELLEQFPRNQSDPASCIPKQARMLLDHIHFYRALATRKALVKDIVAHETGHALGFGMIWADRGLVAVAKSAHFTGPNAVAEYARLSPRATGVPIDAAQTHWNEDPADNTELGRKLRFELMSTGVTTADEERGDNRLTRLTAASMNDIGYQVTMQGADEYRTLVSAPAPIGQSLKLRCGVCLNLLKKSTATKVQS